MPQFDKFSLRYVYSWTEVDESMRHVSVSDDDVIDRSNGYQMLDFMNRFFKISGLISLDSFHHLEKLIYEHMPETYNTRRDMKIWLGENWNKRL